MDCNNSSNILQDIFRFKKINRKLDHSILNGMTENF